MKKSTINYALHVLDSQLENVLSCKTDAQSAYYDGMKLMFNILVSEGYETAAQAKYTDDGKHYLFNK